MASESDKIKLARLAKFYVPQTQAVAIESDERRLARLAKFYQTPRMSSFGDWTCQRCRGRVFAKKSRCKCGQERYAAPPPPRTAATRREPDWMCPNCPGVLVFGSKSRCGKCNEPKPTQAAPTAAAAPAATTDAAPAAVAAEVRTAISCGICYEENVELHALGCGHIVCLGCLNRLCTTTRQCPFCRSSALNSTRLFV
jgi:hypothetical protein